MLKRLAVVAVAALALISVGHDPALRAQAVPNPTPTVEIRTIRAQPIEGGTYVQAQAICGPMWAPVAATECATGIRWEAERCDANGNCFSVTATPKVGNISVVSFVMMTSDSYTLSFESDSLSAIARYARVIVPPIVRCGGDPC